MRYTAENTPEKILSQIQICINAFKVFKIQGKVSDVKKPK